MTDNVDNLTESIDIFDVVCFVLKRFIVILIAMVFCSIAGLFYSYIKCQNETKEAISIDVLNTETKLPGESEEAYANRVNKVNQATAFINGIESLTSLLATQNDYVNNSLYMRIDPLNTACSEAQVVISIDDNASDGMRDALFSSYEHEICYGDYLDSLAVNLGCTTEQLQELIRCTHTPEKSTEDYASTDVVGVLNISVVAQNLDDSELIMDGVIDNLLTVYDGFDSSIVNHTCILASRQSSIIYNNDVREDQLNAVYAIHNLQLDINTQNNNLDNIAKQLGFPDRNSLYEYSVEEHGDTSVGNSSEYIKCSLLGAIIGVIIASFFFVCKYIYGRVIISQSQFYHMFSDIKKIGVCKPVERKSSFVSLLDRLSENDNGLNESNSDSIISANCNNLISNKSKILITGSVSNDVIRNKIKELKLFGDVKLDLFNNPDVLKDVNSYDGIVLVEQRGVSEKKRVRDQIELLKNSGKEIIGAIIV